jgi:ADP-ribosyl-[dinitrogen reductase] hydrolase
MLGAVIGDMVGSVYEWNNRKTKDFTPFFHARSHPTDDSVLTIAVADALLNDRPPVQAFKDWGRRYPKSGWGGRFNRWLFSDETEPYGSFGNGAAMRVSPTALLGKTLDETLASAGRVTAITHDHPEGLKGAAATAHAIYLAFEGVDVVDIRVVIQDEYGYDLGRTVDGIRPGYTFDVTCQGSVPEALICVFEATDFEDAIRNAISIGGDSDTLAAIAGGFAEARFGIPPEIAAEAWHRLPADMRDILETLYKNTHRPPPVR